MHGHSNINSKLAEKSELASGECYSTAKNLNRSRNNLGLEGGGGTPEFFVNFDIHRVKPAYNRTALDRNSLLAKDWNGTEKQEEETGVEKSALNMRGIISTLCQMVLVQLNEGG